MNKSEFLNDLKKYLTILEDREQEDILEEYAQHIDMKLSTGLSEEEAIRDFGSVEELAARSWSLSCKAGISDCENRKEAAGYDRGHSGGKTAVGYGQSFFQRRCKSGGGSGKGLLEKDESGGPVGGTYFGSAFYLAWKTAEGT